MGETEMTFRRIQDALPFFRFGVPQINIADEVQYRSVCSGYSCSLDGRIVLSEEQRRGPLLEANGRDEYLSTFNDLSRAFPTRLSK